jgi:hypothetical protein
MTEMPYKYNCDAVQNNYSDTTEMPYKTMTYLRVYNITIYMYYILLLLLLYHYYFFREWKESRKESREPMRDSEG